MLAVLGMGSSVGLGERNNVEAAKHWSFQSLRFPTPPPIKPHRQYQNEIDYFIQNRLRQEGIEPSPVADSRTLVRRLHLDLTGLPPAPDTIDAFLRDTSPDRYLRLVNQLLDSPHFGERWGMHWLDLARYGDSNGYEKDEPRPYAWHWRDWVINAINEDMPYDQFTVEQLAGDLLNNPTYEQKLGSGFHRNAPRNTAGGTDKEEMRVLSIVDRVDVTGTVWLGLSLSCARCHDHKYDPISQKDYYRLFAYFNNQVDEGTVSIATTEAELNYYHRKLAEHQEKEKQLEAEFAAALAEQKREVEVLLKRHRKRKPKPPASEVDVFQKRTEAPRTSFVMINGDYKQPGEQVAAGIPAVFGSFHSRSKKGPEPDRLDLAHWISSSDNPLFARVEVNRIWQHLFGRGLVATPEDFGKRCPEPEYRELLDWLAHRFVQSGWSRKSMIRTIVLSATYRQASHHRPDLVGIDPGNRFFARQNRFRLEAEVVRDLHLAVSGLLDLKRGGPSFRPPLPEGIVEIPPSYRWEADPKEDCYRRGVYMHYQRNLVNPMLRIFDRQDTVEPCTRRDRTTTPLQALTQMNDPLLLEASLALGHRLLRVKSRNGKSETLTSARLDQAFILCLGRYPVKTEKDRLVQLHDQFITIYTANPDAARSLAGHKEGALETAVWASLARTILNLEEFITRE